MFERRLQASGDRYRLPEAMFSIAQAAKGLPGWPLMSNKMQMHKCEKCVQEFCSQLNQRRHMRAVHRRPLNGDKEDVKKRKEQVGAYWDKLAPETASEIVSSKNLSIGELSAASIIEALNNHLQQPSLLLLPQSYVKTAKSLLDIIQNESSRFPIKSYDLFNILEDASEKNMFCGVTSTSMQRSIFENDPGRVGLESKNLVASLGFLIELRLVTAWMDDKDAEALRCQKALVEEEEAAQKKRAKLQERRRQRKIRLKEIKDKEKKNSDSSHLDELKFEHPSHEGDISTPGTHSSPSSGSSSGADANAVSKSDMNHLNSLSLEDEKSCGNDMNSQESEDWSWKEARQNDGHGQLRQPYNDKRYFDYLHGSQRAANKTSYSSMGNPSPDFSKVNFSKYSSNHWEKVMGLKRTPSVPGNSSAVWTRKAQIPPTVLEEEHRQSNVSKSSEHLKGEDSCCKGQSQSPAAAASVGFQSNVQTNVQDKLETNTHQDLSIEMGTSDGIGALVIGSVTIPLVDGWHTASACRDLNSKLQPSSLQGLVLKTNAKSDNYFNSARDACQFPEQYSTSGCNSVIEPCMQSHGINIGKQLCVIESERDVGDAFEKYQSAETSDVTCSTIDHDNKTEAMDKFSSHNLDVANFLSRRWVRATSSLDAVYHIGSSNNAKALYNQSSKS